jgi:hypothetical protein
MPQHVSQPSITFQFFKRPLEATFDAERISSDGGGLLLRSMDDVLGVSEAFARCLPDTRRASQVIHSRTEQVRQRLYQIALGYPDCNDADALRLDPILKAACGRLPKDPKGLSSQATLTRLENEARPATIRKLIRSLEDQYIAGLPKDTEVIILDGDTTDDPTHGQQELTGFNAHYDTHMYLHLLLFDGQGELVTALLRPGRAGASFGVAGMLCRIVKKLKARFPQAQIVFRGDGAFATPHILLTLENLKRQFGDVHYLLGLPKNPRLVALLEPQTKEVVDRKQAGVAHPVVFTQFQYQTTKSWPHPRLVIGKAEHTPVGLNPRFLVTDIEGFDPRVLYQQGYCARGDAENSIKDFKNALHADRLSCHGFFANFLRLLLFAAAYRLMYGLRQRALELLPHVDDPKPLVLPQAQSLQLDSLRQKLLKVGAQVTQTVRRIAVHLSSSFPYQALFAALAQRLASVQALEVPAG